MSMLPENPSVIVKRKNIQVVLDYCLENRIAGKMTPRDMPEEWEIEFTVDDIMKAIALGMFLKENKLELAGFGSIGTPAPKPVMNSAAPKATRQRKTEKENTKPAVVAATEETVAPAAADIFNEEPAEEIDYFQEKKEENLFM